MCVYRILTREKRTRAFYFALREIAAEQQRCERVLGMLLPPTLVASMRSVVVEAAAEDGSGPGGRGSSSSSSSDTERSGVLNVVSVGSERFAEAFESASVLFAEGAGGFAR